VSTFLRKNSINELQLTMKDGAYCSVGVAGIRPL